MNSDAQKIYSKKGWNLFFFLFEIDVWLIGEQGKIITRRWMGYRLPTAMPTKSLSLIVHFYRDFGNSLLLLLVPTANCSDFVFLCVSILTVFPIVNLSLSPSPSAI